MNKGVEVKEKKGERLNVLRGMWHPTRIIQILRTKSKGHKWTLSGHFFGRRKEKCKFLGY